jgi:DNA polymerase-4
VQPEKIVTAISELIFGRAGHGRVTVRFETRSTGPGPVRTFTTAPGLSRADPLTSLDW